MKKASAPSTMKRKRIRLSIVTVACQSRVTRKLVDAGALVLVV
jgi:hypothetical protein